MTEPKAFTISSLLMAFLFAYSASVQLNDPGTALLVILSYGIPLVFFVFLKGEIEDLRR
ncbi:hypothetical protein MKW98_013610 [Papaver atlanticum]|uniref:Uncharacterized protein n=1 Tax=Papaver atlanticum TaxID=357466 RepID=A0AAD4RZY2_9MAGN|nr:hypothetical protein MKW98_013610 [Papaver atlanticum]